MLDAETLRKCISYDPDTGVFTRIRSSRSDFLGEMRKQVGSNRNHLIFVNGRQYLSHRLAWLYMTGEWPKGMIDHINGDPLDQRFSNLRDVSQQVNSQNVRKANVSNKSTKIMGVYPNGNKFVARLRVNGKLLHIGIFPTIEEARLAHLSAKRRLHEGCTI